ncbi:MAG: hypothetical protein A3F87_04730 [Omnitrophica WOR_2 bacterium RIFCSPLOWO2_12_FULL_51_24]|nr:MAG: hypothetical protein A3I43_06460 [Omnitrophica WOR_2 bacterium RIFCSPLOWO2_02_FULL_50_19]OGX41848.1 MAG: hypothetical protein A3F87_04730 [Omnitrophica WOR_2 bacterium RIFCSPLOWO2_12_FULL_51_24]
MKKLICFLSIFTFIGCLCGISFAAEHPGTDIFEHPGEKTVLGASEIIAAIEKHIDSVTRANNGIFPLHDAEEGKDIALKLVRVHKGKVSYIKKEDAYFACTDFITADGATKYDVDFWMKKGTDGKLDVYMTKIHKKNGTPRFVYKNDEVVEVK